VGVKRAVRARGNSAEEGRGEGQEVSAERNKIAPRANMKELQVPDELGPEYIGSKQKKNRGKFQ